MPRGSVSLLAAVLACLAAAACAPGLPQRCPPGTAPRLVTTLFFGTATSRAPVSEAEWEGFVADTLTAAFPGGFTVLDGDGHWTGGDGPVRERAKVVIVSAERLDTDALARVIDAYSRRFHQESVGRSIAESCGGF